jgi:hypothetical protein
MVEIKLEFTPDQQKMVQKLLGRDVSGVTLPVMDPSQMVYGMPAGAKAGPSNAIPLTTEQKKFLQRELKTSCDYLIVTADLDFTRR